jgi:hypothetical protein
MTIVALVAANGAPGVTTLACALGAVWPVDREVVLAECDPSGGDVAARFGLATDPGVTSLVLALRHGPPDDVSAVAGEHAQQLPGGLAVLVGPIGGDAGAALDRELAQVSLSSIETRDVLVDCGRLDAQSAGQHCVLRDADGALLVVTPDPSGVARGRWALDRLAGLRKGSASVGIAVAGEGIFRPGDVADALGAAVLGVVPRDDVAAGMLAGGSGAQRALARSRLVTFAKRLAPALIAVEPTGELRRAG